MWRGKAYVYTLYKSMIADFNWADLHTARSVSVCRTIVAMKPDCGDGVM
jgi:hypothetical protein